MKGIFCQYKSTFHKETENEIRVPAIPFYMGFDESERIHWVSFSVKLQYAPFDISTFGAFKYIFFPFSVAPL